MSQKKMETLCVPSTQAKSKRWRSWVASILVFFTLLVQPALSQNQPQYHPLELRSAKWFKIKINDLPSEYGPIEKKWLRQGAYQIVIKNSKKTIRKNLAFPQAWQKWKANKKSLF